MLNAAQINEGDEIKIRTQVFVVVKKTLTKFVAVQTYKGQKHVVDFDFEQLDNPHLTRMDLYRQGVLIGSTNGRP